MNITLFTYLNNLAGRSSFFDGLISFIAGPFGILLMIFVFFFLLLHKDKDIFKNEIFALVKKGKEVALFFVAGISAWILTHILKAIFAMPRPFIALQNVHLLIDEKGFDSFPSGHAALFSALAASIYFYHKKLGIVLGICALLIGLARIIGGAHFPVDIIAGYFVGVTVAILTKKIINRNSEINRNWK